MDFKVPKNYRRIQYMAKFVKGQSGNPNGKPKGALNKVTAETKERIQRVINALDETLLEDLASMKPQERAMLWRDLQEYITPKLARTDVKMDADMSIKHITGMKVE